MNPPILYSVIAVALGTVSASSAQTGVVEGAVSTDSLHKHSVPGAEISIPELKLTTHTNFAGEFRLAGIAPGRYLAIATAVGYRSVGDSIIVAASDASYHDFVLATKAIVLDSVVSKAPAVREYISPSLNAFEERRRSGSGGYFITDSILRREEDRPLWEVIQTHAPGAQMTHLGLAVYLVSGRGPSTKALIGGSKSCYPDVYLDGVPMASAPATARSSVMVSLTQFLTTEIGAVEFYPGGASLPAEFNRTSSGCGALLLWTREK